MFQAIVGLVIVVWLPALAPLLVLVFAKSIAASIADTAGRSALPALVDDADLVGANAWFGGTRQAADVLGPLLGGLLVAVANVRTALAIDMITFVIAVPLVLRLPALTPEARAHVEQLDRRRPRGAALPRAPSDRRRARPRVLPDRPHRGGRRRTPVPRS